MRRLFVFILCMPLILSCGNGLSSPDGCIEARIDTDGGIRYSLIVDGRAVIERAPLSMTLSDGTLIGCEKPSRVSSEKTADYGAQTLSFGDFALEFRCYDEGFAWRWKAMGRTPYEIASEQASFTMAGDWPLRVSYAHKNDQTLESQYHDDFENVYACHLLSQWDSSHLAVPPLLVEAPEGLRLVVGEANGLSYPGLFLYARGYMLEGRFAPYPRKEERGGHNELQMQVVEREDYIARCDGSARSFPWRVVAISRDDKSLAQNDLMLRLGGPVVEEDFSWVKPGKVAWEWWNQFALDNVSFKPGVNMPTYQAYIDFASRHGVEYVILDEGWAVKYANDLFAVVPELNLPKLVRYADEKGVGLILWAGYSAFEKDMESVCAHYAQMGFKGFKVDFLDRNDQKMQDFMYRAAQTAARYRLLMDFHGCPPPTGLQLRFPNIVNYEGIFGLEQMRKRPFPEYDMVRFDVTAPFIRFRTGPADYTPGAFLNSTPQTFVNSKEAPMSQGTRCRQLAEYVVFDAPLQMLCDSPSRYEADPECAEFLYRVPTVWDETRILEASLGEYIVSARRKGDTWYIGALTDWTPREFTLKLSELGLKAAKVEAWEDGPDAAVSASDWHHRCFESGPVIHLSLAPGGGWAGIVHNSVSLTKSR